MHAIGLNITIYQVNNNKLFVIIIYIYLYFSHRIQGLVAAFLSASADGDPTSSLPTTLLFDGYSNVTSC